MANIVDFRQAHFGVAWRGLSLRRDMNQLAKIIVGMLRHIPDRIATGTVADDDEQTSQSFGSMAMREPAFPAVLLGIGRGLENRLHIAELTLGFIQCGTRNGHGAVISIGGTHIGEEDTMVVGVFWDRGQHLAGPLGRDNRWAAGR